MQSETTVVIYTILEKSGVFGDSYGGFQVRSNNSKLSSYFNAFGQCEHPGVYSISLGLEFLALCVERLQWDRERFYKLVLLELRSWVLIVGI